MNYHTMKKYVWKHRYAFLVGGILLLSFIAHAWNMFHFPYYENDEAVYVSQAWAVTDMGKLAPYTYWYDHAPGGWFLISLWAKLTGGYFTFGTAVNTGRVLILMLHIASTYFLYFITTRISKSRLAGVFAAILFSVSPLALYFQRRVLLDNIMVFWFLASAALLLVRERKLRHVFASALCFAIACLSKETAVFLYPAFLFLVWKTSDEYNRTMAIVGWLMLSGLVISIYPLYALIKSEFFQYGTRFGGSHPHVSLIETLKFQGSRPGGSIFHPTTSLFWQNMKRWRHHDAFLLIGGVLSFFALAYQWIKHRSSLIGFSVLMTAFSFLFLMRGGVVIEFYVIPLIPLLALSLGIMLAQGVRWLTAYAATVRPWKWKYKPALMVPLASVGLLVLVYLSFGRNYEGLNVYAANQVKPQLQALDWIRNNAMPNDVIVTDNYLWLDLNAPENPTKKVFPNAEWYWKVERDNEIKQGMLGGVPDKIDYVIQTPQVVIDTQTSDFKLIAKTLDQSRPIVSFSNANWSVIIWGQRTPDKIMKRAWESYKKRFILEDGRVADLERPGTFTSQAQSYALLRAVWMNDKATYDQVLSWTQQNLQYENGTFRGVYNPSDTSLVSFTDADEDIALSLIFAYKQWGDTKYYDSAQRALSGIWTVDVATYNGKPYVTAGNWSRHAGGITLNPSYVSPAWYRVFGSFDASRPWASLIPTSYSILHSCTTGGFDTGSGVLPADWCNLDTKSGAITQSHAPQPVSSDYGIDAIRVPWRVALDSQWFGSPDAKSYLQSLSFLKKEYDRTGQLQATYRHNGAARDHYESAATYAGSLGYFTVTDPSTADKIYTDKIAEEFYEDSDKSYWQDPNNYYTQNWAWFATGLYGGQLKNIWAQ